MGSPQKQRCRLCLQDRELRRSHIIPEFFYERLYDDKHRFFAYSTHPGDGVDGPYQKGFRERLLCDDCEGRLARWEQHAREVFFGGVELKLSSDPQKGATARGVDYAKFKLFCMSLLWRCGICSLPYFNEVDLGPHAETLREHLLGAEPDLLRITAAGSFFRPTLKHRKSSLVPSALLRH